MKKASTISEEPEEGDEIETPTYTVEDHLNGKPSKIQDLFEQLREQIFALGDDESITEKANKQYISYKHGKNFCEIWIQASKIKIWLDISIAELVDPHGLARDVSGVGHWGTGDVEVNCESLDDVDKVMELIEQSYQQTI